MRLQISSLVAGILFLCFGPVTYAQSVSKAYDEMSLRQRVGQVFIWTYSGKSMSAVMAKWLERYQPGALIVFSRNIQNPMQVARFNEQIQRLAAREMKAPFFLMVDQEGGVVTRLKSTVPLPSALALGKMDDKKFLENFGQPPAKF